MLAVSVGFLVVPGIVTSNLGATGIKSVKGVIIASQIATSLSVEASIGSIMVGLLLARHNRTKQEADPGGAVSR